MLKQLFPAEQRQILLDALDGEIQRLNAKVFEEPNTADRRTFYINRTEVARAMLRRLQSAGGQG